MRRRLIGLFLGFTFVSAAALSAYGQMHDCMGGAGGMMQGGVGGMHPCGMMDDDHPMWKRLMGLGLDEKQKDAIKALRAKTMKDMVRKKADAQIAAIELNTLLDRDPVDMKAVEAAAKKSESSRTAMFLAHIGAHEELKAILTPEQRKQLKETMEPGCMPGCAGMMGGEEHKDMPMHRHGH